MCSYTPSALQRVKMNVAGTIRSIVKTAVLVPVRSLSAWLSRRRCLQPIRAWLIHKRRQAVLAVLSRLVQLGRQAIRQRCRGNRSC